MRVSLLLAFSVVCVGLVSCGQSNENVSQSISKVTIDGKTTGSVHYVAPDQPLSLLIGAASAKQDSAKQYCVMGAVRSEHQLIESSSASEITDVVEINKKSLSAEALAELQKMGLVNNSDSYINSSNLEKLNRAITEVSVSHSSNNLNCTPVVNSFKKELGIANEEETESLNFWKYVIWGVVNFGSFTSHDPLTQGQWLPEALPSRPRIEQPYRIPYY